ncbi:magnesium/cobalt transporter CorA [Persephonella sp.]|uniref:magnesium/cobalt transporter CorA n=1 Tax=Persephonella sp. TaxID=2060922 RepID=UPI0025EAF69E|nr:magnesium/cobalt transporter CorA [Persephonella sp.]
MIRLFVREKQNIKIVNVEDLSQKWERTEDVLWVDIISPTDMELEWVSKEFEVEFPSKQETQEIEISSRYFEDEESITINAYFLITSEGEIPYNETVTFILKKHYLITVRYKELKTFKELVKKLMMNPSAYYDGYFVFAGILEIRIDTDADTLEFITREISKLGKIVFTGIDITEEILESISFYEELNMTIRENLIDKQRILSSLLKSYKIPKEVREEIRIMIKDVNSLIEYTTFNFERLDYLQNTFLGLLNIQQNQVIKIFTIMSVIFLPPTLIASIYGMNFQYMPELGWKYGYPFAIFLMIISALIPLLIFKKKGWL